ncbi:MAG TPA: 23S rRNA (pseudouridine(1915)-N(3))-methyltransferase RlmH [Bryobacteraceae bacterium]|nr:23S rRNA (pseudouridine(1915)-N(3))-methyltransferase RlmH [Bryobacteraceae bacterium]
MKVHVYYVGKAKDAHANALAAEYIRRADRYAPSAMTEIKPDRAEFWTKHPSAKKILLDPAGKPLDSNAFATIVANAEMYGHDLVFVIGGHDGLPEAWRARADMLLSLSAMTMPHELARAVLAEQIYRAFTILRGHPYPR